MKLDGDGCERSCDVEVGLKVAGKGWVGVEKERIRSASSSGRQKPRRLSSSRTDIIALHLHPHLHVHQPFPLPFQLMYSTRPSPHRPYIRTLSPASLRLLQTRRQILHHARQIRLLASSLVVLQPARRRCRGSHRRERKRVTEGRGGGARGNGGKGRGAV